MIFIIGVVNASYNSIDDRIVPMSITYLLLFTVYSFLFFLIILHFHLDSRNDKSLFSFVHTKENRRKNMKFEKGIVSKICFPIPFFN